MRATDSPAHNVHRMIVTVLVALVILAPCSAAFFIFKTPASSATATSHRSLLQPQRKAAGNDSEQQQQETLSQLGFTDAEINQRAESASVETPKVKVNLVENVDSVTLTAIFFGLIAFNFFVLANLGDGGIGGMVATVINTLKE